MNIYGYIRVSSRDQNEDRQLLSLKQIGVLEKNIYLDKQSGRDFNRPQYRKMVRKLKKDDLLYNKRSKKIVSLKKNEVYAVSKKTVYALLLETQNGDFICEIDKANKALQVINEWKKGDR